MHLGIRLGSVAKPDTGFAFEFPPLPAAIRLNQPRQVANRLIDSDRLYVSNRSDDFKIHPAIMHGTGCIGKG